MLRSVTAAPRATIAIALLFGADGSGVPLVAVAAFTIGSAPEYPGGTLNVAMIVRTAPAGIAPSAHGNGVAQSPESEMGTRPAGVGSASDTPAASDGPALVTVIVKTTSLPATTVAGPLLATWMSA